MLRSGNIVNPRFCVLVDKPSFSAQREGLPLFGWEADHLRQNLLRSGIHESDVLFLTCPTDITELNNYASLCIIFPLGDRSLSAVCGKHSIEKWNLSPLDTVPELTCRKAVPSFSPLRLRQEPALEVYWVKSFLRGAQASHDNAPWFRNPRNFMLNPKISDTLDVLNDLRKVDILSIDIETGRNQINTVGFAWTPYDAIAINTLPGGYGPDNFHKLWLMIAELCGNKTPKVYQNFIYETLYFSKYGVRCQNTWHDTMLAQKLLWPEFDQGLDNVARFYTEQPYWKDDGKNYSQEGKKKDWGNVRDWGRHYDYNCKDTSGTLEACLSQRNDLRDRGLTAFYDKYLMRLAPAVAEMCSRGLPVSSAVRLRMKADLEAELQALKAKLPPEFNPNSPKQKLKFFKDKGYLIPKVRDAKKGGFRESADELSLKKMRLKHPDDTDIETLLSMAKAQKALSSYVDIECHDDGRLRYSLNITGTETLRFACHKDPWDMGLNAQTLPKKYRSMFVAPPGLQFFQVDLKQAESRFVAYDSCDTELIRMLETGEDIHKHVAMQILRKLRKPETEYSKDWRQLGKKSGHGANYAMKEATFQDSCLKEMNLVLSKTEANAILEAYHDLFPGIRRWHREIIKTLRNKRQLSNPLGFTRYFYGRLDDNTFREGFAFKPQSTIPMITNHLMLHLLDARAENKFSFELCLQVHDSLIMLGKPEELLRIGEFCRKLSNWHPEIILPAGKLLIPVDCEVGNNLKELKTLEGE